MSEWASTPFTGPHAEREALADRFCNWELRGRGWQSWPYACALEPPFRGVQFNVPPDPRAPDTWQEPWADAASNAAAFQHLPVAAAPKGPCLDEALFAALPAAARRPAPA